MTAPSRPYNKSGRCVRGDAMQTYCFVVDPVSDRDEKAIRSVILHHQIHAKAARLRNRAGKACLEVVVADANEMSRIAHLATLISGRKVAYEPWRQA